MRNQLIAIVITTLISGSLGYGLSQSQLATTVARLNVTVEKLQSSIDIEIDSRKYADENLSKLVTDLISLQKAQIDQASQLIALIKVQNQILSK